MATQISLTTLTIHASVMWWRFTTLSTHATFLHLAATELAVIKDPSGVTIAGQAFMQYGWQGLTP